MIPAAAPIDRAPVTPTPVLVAAAVAPRVTAAQLLAGRGALVVVAPHPDDETLGAGCLLHDAAALGVSCRVVCLTDGSASHRGSRAWGPDRIAEARQAELRAALAILAPGVEPEWLGHRDCGLPTDGPAADACAERLERAFPRGALVVAAWGRDPHVDHERGAALVARAARARLDLRVMAYPVWGRFGDEPAPEAVVIEASAAARLAKRRALACHATQMTRLIDDDPDGFVMSAEHQAHFLDHPEILLTPDAA